jgi:hypothetical protein
MRDPWTMGAILAVVFLVSSLVTTAVIRELEKPPR